MREGSTNSQLVLACSRHGLVRDRECNKLLGKGAASEGGCRGEGRRPGMWGLVTVNGQAGKVMSESSRPTPHPSARGLERERRTIISARREPMRSSKAGSRPACLLLPRLGAAAGGRMGLME
eukprot:scaffold1449_cov108-Isochrysis_galbana.AAC.2